MSQSPLPIALSRLLDAQGDLPAAIGSRLARVPSASVSGAAQEAPFQELLADRLWDMGFEVSRIVPKIPAEYTHHPSYRAERDLTRSLNVWGTRRGRAAGRSLLLVSHPDTLPPDLSLTWPGGSPYAGSREGGRVWGPGSASGKAGFAAALAAAELLQQAGVHLAGDLTLGSVVDEAGLGCQGMLHLVLEGVRADAALYLGGPGPGFALSGSGLGSCSIRVEAAQESAGEEVLRGLLATTQEFRRAAGNLGLRLERLLHTVESLRPITTIELRFAIAPGEGMEQRAEDLGLRLTEAVRKLATTTGFSPGSCTVEPWRTENAAFTQVVRDSVAQAWGSAIREELAPPSGAFLLCNHGGMPTAFAGRCLAVPANTPESVSAQDLLAYTRFLCRLMVEWCGVA